MKTIIDLDDALLQTAQAELGTTTTNDTVNEALRYVAERSARARAILDDPCPRVTAVAPRGAV